VTSKNVLDSVDDTGPCLAGFLAKHGQPPILLIRGGGDIDLPQPADWLALQ
jgi:hypothetical protein